ncbi:MAG: hypothetical protein WC732_08835 [Candidatus Omnitrophota bacterium]
MRQISAATQKSPPMNSKVTAPPRHKHAPAASAIAHAQSVASSPVSANPCPAVQQWKLARSIDMQHPHNMMACDITTSNMPSGMRPQVAPEMDESTGSNDADSPMPHNMSGTLSITKLITEYNRRYQPSLAIFRSRCVFEKSV